MRRRRRKGRRRRRRRRKKKKKNKQQQQPPPRQKRKQKPPEGSEPAARHPRGCHGPGERGRRRLLEEAGGGHQENLRVQGDAGDVGAGVWLRGRGRALSLPPGMRGGPAGGCGSLRGDLRTRGCCSAPRASSPARSRSDLGTRRKIELWGRSWASITPHPSPIPPEKAIKRKNPKCFKIFIEREARGRFFLDSATVNKCGLTCTLPLTPMAAAIRGQTSRNNRSGLDVF